MMSRVTEIIYNSILPVGKIAMVGVSANRKLSIIVDAQIENSNETITTTQECHAEAVLQVVLKNLREKGYQFTANDFELSLLVPGSSSAPSTKPAPSSAPSQKAHPTKKSHYQLVYDEDQVRQFAKLFVEPAFPARCDGKGGAEQQDDRVMLLILLAREKYLPNKLKQSNGNIHLNRSLVKRGDAQEFVRLIKRYETPIGTYVDFGDSGQMDDGKLNTIGDSKTSSTKTCQSIPNDALAFYFDLHVKSPYKALHKLMTQVHGEEAARVFNPQATIPTIVNLPSKFTSCIHSTNATFPDVPKYLDIDLDTKDPSIARPFMEQMYPQIEVAVYAIVETRNGYHIILSVKDCFGKVLSELFKFLKDRKITSFQETTVDRKGNLCQKTWISHNNEPMVPIPGTLSGGFPVRLVDNSEFVRQMTAAS
jgi:hypothetical protein